MEHIASSHQLHFLICTIIYIYQVRKEKLGDRITALHQLVSPFGKVTALINEVKKARRFRSLLNEKWQ